MIKVITIKCESNETYDLNDLIFFQGKLKSITDDKFLELKKSLIKDGLPLGFHIWKNKDKVYLIDGHHRFLALKALRDEGYFVDKIPCMNVLALNKKEAAQSVLISNSKYAHISEDSLSDFMIEFDLQMDSLENLDLGDLNLNLFDKNNEQKESEEIDLDFKYKIEIDCENEEMQQSLTEELEKRGFKVRVLI